MRTTIKKLLLWPVSLMMLLASCADKNSHNGNNGNTPEKRTRVRALSQSPDIAYEPKADPYILKEKPGIFTSKNSNVIMTESRFKKIGPHYKSSGLTVYAFCRNEGLIESRFYYWQRKLRQTTAYSANNPYSFIPPVFNPNERMLSIVEPISTYSLPSDISLLPSCETIYSNGIQIKFHENIQPKYIRLPLIFERE